ncbi:YbhB/YbcL family Raf kinase inhibitor-like protein [Thermococcus zilligii]|uniref:YbhB/YbcL family Raf kinase inhibitor-like protein n=1 Tax=Thermococcus zilligii TaxID=54076 RepID=UPI0004983860|nr:YbhB/YbcL family Raf kinase inhibitor-like protein [Thermococcus zilligii]
MRWVIPAVLIISVALSGCVSGGGGKMGAKTLEVGSVFHDGERIPKEYTCEGDDINPPVYIGKLPEGTKSLAIVVDDPDAPAGTFTHWIAWNIPPTGEIPMGIPKEGEVNEPIHAIQGKNDFGRIGYNGPCPPRGHGVHHYHFRVYALDTELHLKPGSSRKDLEKAMEGHILAWGEAVGLYERR